MATSQRIVETMERVGRRLQEQYGDRDIPRAEIVRQVVEDCDCGSSSVLPSDHCYNRTNEGILPPPANMPMFEHVGSGRYRFVGLNHPYTGPLYHYPKGGPRRQVGEWVKGRLKWYAEQQHVPEASKPEGLTGHCAIGTPKSASAAEPEPPQACSRDPQQRSSDTSELVEGRVIDDAFIARWHPKYDETETDEPRYQCIASKVQREIRDVGGIGRETFTDILDWKAARVKGKIDWQNTDRYIRCFKLCLEAESQERLAMLAGLPGVGVPVASTILHFMEPSKFPIMDVRTVEVLHRFRYIKHRSRDLKRYPLFQNAIHSVQCASPTWSLRQIDRALFAFHKQRPQLFPPRRQCDQRECDTQR